MKRAKRVIARTNAVIYCRVSTEEQVGNYSLTTQEQRSIGYCSQQGWPVVKIFKDEGQSAKTALRPEFQKVLEYCKDERNGVGFFVVNDLSRFSRNAADQGAIRARLITTGVVLRSVSEPIDETSSGSLMANVLAALNQFDNDRKSERTKEGMQKAASLGRFTFRAPLGYKNVPRRSNSPSLEHDPISCGQVKKAFELASTGLHSTAEVLRIVTGLGLRTTKGKPVPAQTFQRMLINPLYAGWVSCPGLEVNNVRGDFQPIIDQKCFDAVQDILAGRRPNLTSYERNNPDFPLRRFVRCGKCGTSLTGSWSSGRHTKYAYYHCPKKSCLAVNVKQEKLQSSFLNWLEWLTPQQEAMDEIKDTIRTVWKQREGDAQDLQRVLIRKSEKIETRKTTLVNRWLDGDIDQDGYKEQIARLSLEIDEVKQQLRATEFEHIELEGVLAFAEKIVKRPSRLWVESSLGQRQRLQETLFPNGISFDGEQFGTDSTSLFFSLIGKVSSQDYDLVSPTGFEPVLPP